MAFGGIGAAGGLVDAGSIAGPAGQYASQPNGPVSAVAADNVFWQKTAVEERSVLNAIRINAITLEAKVAGGTDVANPDTGGFITGDVVANYHVLPANFGPGRGHWTDDLAEKVSIQFFVTSADDGANPTAGEVVANPVPAPFWVTPITIGTSFGRDLQIIIRNFSVAVGGAATAAPNNEGNCSFNCILRYNP